MSARAVSDIEQVLLHQCTANTLLLRQLLSADTINASPKRHWCSPARIERKPEGMISGIVRAFLNRLRVMGRSALQKAAERAAAAITCPITFILMRRIDPFYLEGTHAAHPYLT